MIDRQEVEALLRACDSSMSIMDIVDTLDREKVRALCRAWLALQEAPQRMVGDGISYGVSVAGTGIANGQRVRIVKEVGDD